MHTDSTHSDSNAPGHHNSEYHASSAAAMEDRYARNERVWSGDPNAALLNAVASMGLDVASPRTALDIGCGEGADAVWLAQQVGRSRPLIMPQPPCAAPRNWRLKTACRSTHER